MKLSRKIYLIIAIFVIPLVSTMAYFSWTGVSKDIGVTAKEIDGTNYLEAAGKPDLSREPARVAGATADWRGHDIRRRDFEGARLVDADFAGLMDADRDLGAGLQMSESDVHDRGKENIRRRCSPSCQ